MRRFLQAAILIAAACVPALAQESWEIDRHALPKRLLEAMPENIRTRFADKLDDRSIVDQILRAYDEKYRLAAEQRDHDDERCIESYKAAAESDGDATIVHFRRAECLLNSARYFIENDEYHEAFNTLQTLLQEEDAYLIEPAEAKFLLGLSCAKLATAENGLAGLAVSILEAVENDFEVPKRYQESAAWIAAEVREGLGGRFADVAERAKHLSDKIANGDTGKKVQRKQEQLIKDLDELVEQAEKHEEETMGRSKDKEMFAAKDPKHEDPGKLGKEKPKRDWQATMSDRERAQILQLMEKMPSHYRELINQYYRSLAETPRKKE